MRTPDPPQNAPASLNDNHETLYGCPGCQSLLQCPEGRSSLTFSRRLSSLSKLLEGLCLPAMHCPSGASSGFPCSPRAVSPTQHGVLEPCFKLAGTSTLLTALADAAPALVRSFRPRCAAVSRPAHIALQLASVLLGTAPPDTILQLIHPAPASGLHTRECAVCTGGVASHAAAGLRLEWSLHRLLSFCACLLSSAVMLRCIMGLLCTVVVSTPFCCLMLPLLSGFESWLFRSLLMDG